MNFIQPIASLPVAASFPVTPSLPGKSSDGSDSAFADALQPLVNDVAQTVTKAMPGEVAVRQEAATPQRKDKDLASIISVFPVPVPPATFVDRPASANVEGTSSKISNQQISLHDAVPGLASSQPVTIQPELAHGFASFDQVTSVSQNNSTQTVAPGTSSRQRTASSCLACEALAPSLKQADPNIPLPQPSASPTHQEDLKIIPAPAIDALVPSLKEADSSIPLPQLSASAPTRPETLQTTPIPASNNVSQSDSAETGAISANPSVAVKVRSSEADTIAAAPSSAVPETQTTPIAASITAQSVIAIPESVKLPAQNEKDVTPKSQSAILPQAARPIHVHSQGQQILSLDQRLISNPVKGDAGQHPAALSAKGAQPPRVNPGNHVASPNGMGPSNAPLHSSRDVHETAKAASQHSAEQKPDSSTPVAQETNVRASTLAPTTPAPDPKPVPSTAADTPPFQAAAPVARSPVSSVSSDASPSPAMKLQPNTQADPLMPSPAAAGPVQMARIVEHINQSEMHIGLRTSAFGSVEVHTVIHDSQVGLAMGGEKGDLRAFVSSELPDLQAAFQQHDLRFENIHFLSNTSTLGAGISSGTDSQSRPFHHAPQPAEIVPPFDDPMHSTGEPETIHDHRPALNLHA